MQTEVDEFLRLQLPSIAAQAAPVLRHFGYYTVQMLSQLSGNEQQLVQSGLQPAILQQIKNKATVVQRQQTANQPSQNAFAQNAFQHSQPNFASFPQTTQPAPAVNAFSNSFSVQAAQQAQVHAAPTTDAALRRTAIGQLHIITSADSAALTVLRQEGFECFGDLALNLVEDDFPLLCSKGVPMELLVRLCEYVRNPSAAIPAEQRFQFGSRTEVPNATHHQGGFGGQSSFGAAQSQSPSNTSWFSPQPAVQQTPVPPKPEHSPSAWGAPTSIPAQTWAPPVVDNQPPSFGGIPTAPSPQHQAPTVQRPEGPQLAFGQGSPAGPPPPAVPQAHAHVPEEPAVPSQASLLPSVAQNFNVDTIDEESPTFSVSISPADPTSPADVAYERSAKTWIASRLANQGAFNRTRFSVLRDPVHAVLGDLALLAVGGDKLNARIEVDTVGGKLFLQGQIP
eukprot:TRINITY_DN759_c0_g1_i1.p1 TRINITY_DN759_c0_g1~~TRINITY_DN759_c0_g1_i1.p1  ORF type:complete len:459 (+),score=59.97 TRINITY_DN759_c0_g1_i1:24-1379(+)